MGLPARDLNDDDYNIEPDIRPNFGLIEGGNQTTPERASLKLLKNAESNPDNINTGSISNQEESGSSPSENNWKTNLTKLDPTTAGRMKFALNKANFKKNKWPTIIILIFLLLGGTGISMVSLGSLGIVQIEKSLTKMLDNSAHPLKNRALLDMQKKFRNSFALSSDGKCNIKCKLTTINEKTLNKYKNQGFEIETEKGTGLFANRYIIKSLTFPNNGEGPQQPIKNGADFAKALENPSKLSSFNKVLNTKSAFFNNSKFVSTIKTKFGINKQSDLTAKTGDEAKDKSTSVKDRVKASMRKALGLPEIDLSKPPKTAVEKVKDNPKYKDAIAYATESKAVKKFNAAGGIADKICGVYDVSRGVDSQVKASKIAAFTGFAMLYLSYSSKLMTGEETEPEVPDTIGRFTTETDSNGNTMTSSPAFRGYTMGDPISLSADEYKYSLANSSKLTELIGGFLAAAGITGAVGYKFYHAICSAQMIKEVAEIAAVCPVEAEASILTAVETGGLSALIGMIWCTMKAETIKGFISIAAVALLGYITQSIAASELPPIDESLIGSAGGLALSSGTAQILAGKSASYGLAPGNYEQIKTFQNQIASSKKQDIEVAKYEGSKNPFDVYNEYSFLGSIAQNSNITSLINNRSLSAHIGSLLSFLPNSLASINNNTYAAESNKMAELYNDQCDDPGLNEIGVDGDGLCNVSFYMTDAEMTADIETVTQYMIDNNYIDESTGEVKKSTKPNDYQLYLENCGEGRVDPWGTTSSSISEGDITDLELYAWKIGKKCTESNEKMSNFHTYTMSKAILDTIDEETKKTSGGTPAGVEIDMANIYSDSTGVGCAAGTTEVGDMDGYDEGKLIRVKVCSIPNTTDDDNGATWVNSRVSGYYLNIFNAMMKDTGQSSIHTNSSFRTMAMQTDLYNNPQGYIVAPPGFSPHQMGLAIDVQEGSTSANWLIKNSSTYKIYQLAGDPVHWTPFQ